MMPNKDGWSVLTELKSDPATRDYPVIICSILEQADKGFSLGAADYLVKPILEEDLVHALDRLNKNGTIHEVLVIDDDPNDLRLIEKILDQQVSTNRSLPRAAAKAGKRSTQGPRMPSSLIYSCPRWMGSPSWRNYARLPCSAIFPCLLSAVEA